MQLPDHFLVSCGTRFRRSFEATLSVTSVGIASVARDFETYQLKNDSGSFSVSYQSFRPVDVLCLIVSALPSSS